MADWLARQSAADMLPMLDGALFPDLVWSTRILPPVLASEWEDLPSGPDVEPEEIEFARNRNEDRTLVVIEGMRRAYVTVLAKTDMECDERIDALRGVTDPLMVLRIVNPALADLVAANVTRAWKLHKRKPPCGTR